MLTSKKTYNVLFNLLCSLFYVVSCISFAEESHHSTNKLNNIKQAITSQKQKISTVSKKTKALEKQLKQGDIAISNVAKALNITQTSLTNTTKKLAILAKQKKQLTQQQQQQEKLLAKQLQSAYTSGNHDYLKLLLNQEDPSNIQRTITYYQYLNNARVHEIENFKTTINTLLDVVTEEQEKSTQLKQLKTQQVVQQSNLKQAKLARTKTIKQLNSQLSSSKQQLSKLVDAEENLLIEIQRLAKLAKASISLNGLSKVKAKLSWPVKGRLQHTFGSKKQGYLKWKGVLISAPSGREVNSIYHGKVLFSDWLKGYGLVTVVDHGNGYMSLYGHNQALLKAVGDTVKAGEAIALVGQSGGLNSPALYFEVRHKGQALNPKQWCK